MKCQIHTRLASMNMKMMLHAMCIVEYSYIIYHSTIYIYLDKMYLVLDKKSRNYLYEKYDRTL